MRHSAARARDACNVLPLPNGFGRIVSCFRAIHCSSEPRHDDGDPRTLTTAAHWAMLCERFGIEDEP
jgi:hypothetical protein